MGKIIRRVIAALLAVTAIIISVLPAASVEATTSTHGDYEYDGSTIVKYLGDETILTIPDWITGIGSECFAGNENLQRIMIPDSVRSIDFGAFRSCPYLMEVSLPESIRTIGSAAFSSCPNLQFISLPDKLDELGSGVFAGDTMLTNVPISSENTNYVCVDGAIYTSDGKTLVQYLAGRPSTKYEMPLSVENIGEYAFWGASNLNDISISSGVKHIPEYAFDNCDGLIKVELPGSITRINAYAFADCDNLQYINIPYSVGYIDDRAFTSTNNAKVRFIDANGNIIKLIKAEYADEYVNGEEVPDVSEEANVEPNENTESVNEDSSENTDGNTLGSNIANETYESQKYNGSFSGGSGWISEIDSVNFSDNKSDGEMASSMILGGNAFLTLPTSTTVSEGYNLKNAEGEDSYAASSGQYPIDDNDNQIVGDIYSKYNGLESNLTIPEGIRKIGARAFYDNKALSNILLPDGLEEIDDFALARTDISSIVIPEGTTKIGYGSFYKCENLRDVYIPESVNDIELGAFTGSRWLDYWKDPKAVIARETRAEDEEAPKEMINVNPESVRNNNKDDDNAKYDYAINDNGIIIPNPAKYPQNKNNEKGYNPDDYLIVGDGILLAYRGSDSVIKIPENVKYIGPAAFEKNYTITSVTLAPSVEKVCEDAFNGCSQLSKLNLNDGLKNIEDRAFRNTRLSVVYIPDSVETIGLAAFDTCGNGNTLKTVIFEGDSLPEVSYKDTATRLSSRNLRTRAFEGVENAIIEAGAELDNTNMFDPRFYGFEGCVYTIDTKSGNPKTLILEKSLKQPDEDGRIVINSMIPIAGDVYRIDNVKQKAFDNYMSSSDWCDYSPKKITIDGVSSSSLNELLQSINSDIDNGSLLSDGIVEVNLSSDVFPLGSYGMATVTDSSDSFKLYVKRNDNDIDALKQAYMAAFGSQPSSSTAYLDLDLYDRSGTIPIHKLGSSKMEVVLPLPSSLKGKSNLRVACLDDNGLITELSSEVDNQDGGDYIGFVTGHCSAYMMYEKVVAPQLPANTTKAEGLANSFKSNNDFEIGVLADEDVNTNAGEKLDADLSSMQVDIESAGAETGFGTSIMKTLNRETANGIEVKWFVVAILLAAALGLCLYKPLSKK